MEAFFSDVSPNFPYQTAKLIVYSLTLLTETLSLLHFVVIGYLVFQNKLIHRNLKIVGYNLCICGSIKNFTSIYMFSKRIFFPNFMLPLLLADIFYTIREVALDGMIIVPSMIVIERMFSILKAKTYENWFSWKFIIVICCSVWPFVIWIMVNMFYLPSVIPISYTYATVNLLLFVVYTCYFISYCAMAKKSVIGLTLSERYQHAENQAAYGTVLKFAITTALIIIIASLLLVLRQYLPSCFENVSLRDKESFYRSVFELILGCLHFLSSFFFVSVHPSLKKQYRKFFRFALCKRNKVAAAGESTSVVHIQSFTGQNLKVPDETNFYFKSLTDQWDAKLVKTKKPLVKIS